MRRDPLHATRPGALRDQGPKALLFDLDGTLYPKLGLRLKMLAELALEPLVGGGLGEAWNTWRGVRGFRRVREGLRNLGDDLPDLAKAQYRLAAESLGLDAEHLQALVDTWIHQRPLRHLRSAARPDLLSLLNRLRARGLRLGVFSDYPAEAKLQAMGVLSAFDLVMDAEDPEISALKPHPKGLLTAAAAWGLAPAEVIYVGDRRDVDAPAAARAGMACLLIGAGKASADASWQGIDRLKDIETLIDAPTCPAAPRVD